MYRKLSVNWSHLWCYCNWCWGCRIASILWISKCRIQNSM